VTTRCRGDRGETLIELLITILIMSSAIIAIVAGIAVASNSSDAQKKQVGVLVVLRDYAEAIAAGTYPGGCADPVVSYTPPPGYPMPTITERAWYDGTSNDPANFTSTCPGPSATAIRLTLDAVSNDNRAHRTLQVVRAVDYVRPS
jgi:type II secretory pathway pseudopilin PulG